jgi:hypothetical protein
MVRLRASLPLLSRRSVVAVGWVLLVLGLAAFAQTGLSSFLRQACPALTGKLLGVSEAHARARS